MRAFFLSLVVTVMLSACGGDNESIPIDNPDSGDSTISNPDPMDSGGSDSSADDSTTDSDSRPAVEIRGQHESCLGAGVECEDGLACIVDGEPATAAICKRVCDSNAECPGDSECLLQILSDGSGVCVNSAPLGARCDGFFEGGDWCLRSDFGPTACDEGRCIGICAFEERQWDCPPATYCEAGDDVGLCKSQEQCVPKTCADAGAQCGLVDDGCGRTIECGECESGVCGGGGEANRCIDCLACEVGAVVCEDGRQRSCATQADGCRAWQEVECADGFCANAESCGSCVHQCYAGETTCEGGQRRSCVADANGCLGWSEPMACESGFCGSSRRCGVCSHQCDLGAVECNHLNRERTCNVDAHGCRRWSNWDRCESGFCDGNTCGVCDDECDLGAKRCANGATQTCGQDANGCLVWNAPVDCIEGFCADAERCGSCNNECSGDVCLDGEMRTCLSDANGCRYWGETSVCAEGFCATSASCGTCAHECPAVDAVCGGDAIQRCDEDMNGCRFVVETTCGDGSCRDGACECTFDNGFLGVLENTAHDAFLKIDDDTVVGYDNGTRSTASLIDISSNTPRLLSELSFGGVTMAVRGNTLFGRTGTSAVRAWNIQNRAFPLPVLTFGGGHDSISKLVVHEDRLYIVHRRKIQVFNIVDPNAPVSIGVLELAEDIKDIAVAEQLLVKTMTSIRFYDLGDALPTFSHVEVIEGHAIWVDGDGLWVRRSTSLWYYSLANDSVVLRDSAKVSLSSALLSGANEIAFGTEIFKFRDGEIHAETSYLESPRYWRDDKVLVSSNGDLLHFKRAKLREGRSLVPSLWSVRSNGILIDGDVVYSHDSRDQLSIHSRTSAEPVRIASQLVNGSRGWIENRMVTHQGVLYIPHSRGVMRFDIRDPSMPLALSSLNPGSGCDGIAVTDDLLVSIRSRWSGVLVRAVFRDGSADAEFYSNQPGDTSNNPIFVEGEYAFNNRMVLLVRSPNLTRVATLDGTVLARNESRIALRDGNKALFLDAHNPLANPTPIEIEFDHEVKTIARCGELFCVQLSTDDKPTYLVDPMNPSVKKRLGALGEPVGMVGTEYYFIRSNTLHAASTCR